MLDWLETMIVASCPSGMSFRKDARRFVGVPPVPTVAGLVGHFKPQFPSIFVNLKESDVRNICIKLSEGNWGTECEAIHASCGTIVIISKEPYVRSLTVTTIPVGPFRALGGF